VPAAVSSRLIEPAAALTSRMLRVRWLVRAPVWLYRARLGVLMGSRMLMLEHTGRKTGARRHVVLEIVDHPEPGRYVVVSGLGTRAQWFQNVRANPRVRVYLGSRRPEPAVAGLMTTEQASAALRSFAAGHPRSWAALRPVLEATLGTPVSEHETGLPLLSLRLDGW
jgi:deazaflavin-dependent oxidoreductase (nitroreductase family)